MNKLDPTIAKESPALFWLVEFNGINLHDDRRSIGDQECAWLENFAPLGAGNARSMYDNGTPIYTAAGTTIEYDFPFNIAGIFYHALFMADGSAVSVRVDTADSTGIAVAGTFTSATLPACAQWGDSGILIVTSGGYYAYDGTLYSPSGPAPAWLSGLLAPIVTTGDTNTSTSITNVASVQGLVIGMMINGSADIPAYPPTSTLITAFDDSANTITLSQAATGTTGGVTLTIQWMMPIGITGDAIEIYQHRVWVFNGAQFSFSAPSNGADFSTSDGGGTAKSTDSFLKVKYVNAKQANGFLYLFGDASINVISNVQTGGSPTTTSFNNQNVDPQTGLGWKDALVAYGRALCFANPTGVYALYGGAAQKISDKIDYLFEKANFINVTPTMFVASIFGARCLGIILNTTDPTTNTNRTLMALWNGTKWFIASQSLQTAFASTMEIDSNPQGWANDVTNVFQLFLTPSVNLTKKIQTKLWAGQSLLIDKTARAVYVETNDLTNTGIVVNGTVDSDTNTSVSFSISQAIYWVNNAGGLITFVNNLGQPLQFLSDVQGLNGTKSNQAGRRLGLTMTSQTADFELLGTGLTYGEESYYGP